MVSWTGICKLIVSWTVYYMFKWTRYNLENFNFKSKKMTDHTERNSEIINACNKTAEKTRFHASQVTVPAVEIKAVYVSDAGIHIQN